MHSQEKVRKAILRNEEQRYCGSWHRIDMGREQFISKGEQDIEFKVREVGEIKLGGLTQDRRIET